MAPVPVTGAAEPAPATAPVAAVSARLRSAGCVFAEDEARLLLGAAATGEELDALLDRRIAGEPLEHVLGWAEFCGLRIAVEPGVFVPRRRTQLLAQQAAALAIEAAASSGPAPGSSPGRGPVVVDLCCGSGAVGVAVAAAVRTLELHAVDVDPAAVRCARRNLARAGGHVHQGDLYEALPASLRGAVDVLVANAPYVPSAALATLPAEARLHEPRVALDGGPDGLRVLRRVSASAPHWLAPGGWLLVESSEDQAPRVLAEYAHAGLTGHVVTSEELAATVVVGRWPGSGAGL